MEISNNKLNNRVSLMDSIRLLSILMIHILIIKFTPDSFIMKLLITIPLTSGYSYVIYRAVRAKEFDIRDMFKGYKFCKRTRITFISLELLDIATITTITCVINKYIEHDLLNQYFIHAQALFMHYVTFRLSFIRYLSMNTFELKNKPLPYASILKRSWEITKNKYISFFVMIIVITGATNIGFHIIFNILNINDKLLIMVPIISSVIVRYYEELLRIKVLEKSNFNFNI